jgi:hypothetical protein
MSHQREKGLLTWRYILRKRAMIGIEVKDGLYLITLPKGLVVLTKAEFIQALRRGKWWRRRETLQARAQDQTAS